MTCHEWIVAIDTLINQFAVLIPIALGAFLIQFIRSFINNN